MSVKKVPMDEKNVSIRPIFYPKETVRPDTQFP